jgi:hypothetical protein
LRPTRQLPFLMNCPVHLSAVSMHRLLASQGDIDETERRRQEFLF